MKVKAYVLAGIIGLLSVSAVPKDVRSVEGFLPGDFAPRIESLENESSFNFRNHSGRYTLLNFWAAYDAESRVRNIKLSNAADKFNPEKIAFCSISFDEKESVFSETIRIDKLNRATQFQAREVTNEDLYGKYNLKRGFKNFLINDQGMIVAVNINPGELTNVLDVI